MGIAIALRCSNDTFALLPVRLGCGASRHQRWPSPRHWYSNNSIITSLLNGGLFGLRSQPVRVLLLGCLGRHRGERLQSYTVVLPLLVTRLIRPFFPLSNAPLVPDGTHSKLAVGARYAPEVP